LWFEGEGGDMMSDIGGEVGEGILCISSEVESGIEWKE
jgi:hypothetical protein